MLAQYVVGAGRQRTGRRPAQDDLAVGQDDAAGDVGLAAADPLDAPDGESTS
jgi:hypothetical protein